MATRKTTHSLPAMLKRWSGALRYSAPLIRHSSGQYDYLVNITYESYFTSNEPGSFWPGNMTRTIIGIGPKFKWKSKETIYMQTSDEH